MKTLRTLNNNSDVALELFSTIGLGTEKELSKKAKSILIRCNHRTDVLKEMIKLCPDPTTAKQLYIVSTAYVWLGAAYRLEAIKYLLKYIDAGAVWEGTPKDIINIYGYDQSQIDLNISNVYYNLGQCYEKEYMFNEAIEAYRNSNKYNPYFAYNLVLIAGLFVKKDDYMSAFRVLENARLSIYYKNYEYYTCDNQKHIKDDFMIAIDTAYEDINKKFQRGYKYRPRPSK